MDHYYDFFFGEMLARNYSCVYAPKPASACLEVSPRSDGCALFIHKSKLRVVSTETLTYALSTRNITTCPLTTSAPTLFSIRPQNQVAVIAVCEVLGSFPHPPPQLIVSTTHLKAAKNALGELYRFGEADQLLRAIQRVRDLNSGAAVLLCGDMNARPDDSADYPPLTYYSIKGHSLGLRSVYNDDEFTETVSDGGSSPVGEDRGELLYDEDSFRFYEQKPPPRRAALAIEGVYTTWKARSKRGKEKVSKHCIDYIFYTPEASLGTKGTSPVEASLRATAVLDVYTENEVGAALLPSAMYPSDHLAIAADLLLEWTTPSAGGGGEHEDRPPR